MPALRKTSSDLQQQQNEMKTHNGAFHERCEMEGGTGDGVWAVSLAGAATRIISVVTKVLSQQNCLS